MTEHLQNQINNLPCNHPKTEIRYRLASNDVKMFAHQCIRCGEVIGQWIPHGDVENLDSILPIDEILKEYFHENCRELKLALEERIEKKEVLNDDWYPDYLKSPEWEYKRGLVFERCNWLCEGCRVNRATIVHHLTYKNIGNELLFELVGVCKDCHDRLHPHRKEDD